jgi:hypothetical protein
MPANVDISIAVTRNRMNCAQPLRKRREELGSITLTLWSTDDNKGVPPALKLLLRHAGRDRGQVKFTPRLH